MSQIVSILLVLTLLCASTSAFSTPLNRSARTGSSLSMGLRSSVRKMFRRQERTDDELKSGIAKFYDQSSSIWLRVWGEDMHHGYYPIGENSLGVDHQAKQKIMIDKALEYAYGDEKNPEPASVVDVGCGVGGSSRYIARKYPTIKSANGVSLSPFQIERAREFTTAQGLEGVAKYDVMDATKMKFADDSFDLTWSMESGEHMPDKEVFMNELVRVTAPGGRIIVVTWCHRELAEGETELTDKEKRLLDKINDAYYLPDWVPTSDYTKLAAKYGLEDIRTEDWSDYVAPFWPAVIRSALRPWNFVRLMGQGATTVHGAVATLWMMRGFQKGLVRFAVITGRKPTAKKEQD